MRLRRDQGQALAQSADEQAKHEGTRIAQAVILGDETKSALAAYSRRP